MLYQKSLNIFRGAFSAAKNPIFGAFGVENVALATKKRQKCGFGTPSFSWYLYVYTYK